MNEGSRWKEGGADGGGVWAGGLYIYMDDRGGVKGEEEGREVCTVTVVS